jgi:hypothetical protein
MKTLSILFLLLGLDALILLLEAQTLSIGYRETLLLDKSSFLSTLVHQSMALFGQNDIALRLPMILMHFISVILLFSISKALLKRDYDRLWLVAIYMLLPGVNSAALLVDGSGLVLVLLFAFVYLHQRDSWVQYLLLIGLVGIDASFVYLYLGLLGFTLFSRAYGYALFAAILMIGSFLIFGIDTSGSPRGHFLDTIGLYMAIFSPIVFVYIGYILYRRVIRKKLDLLWFLATVPFLLSLVLSFRQAIGIEHFAPYLILAIPLAVQSFFHSYRVRLRRYRTSYRRVFAVSLALLLLNLFAVLGNKALYQVLDDPTGHFAYRQHIAKELAATLKAEQIDCVSLEDIYCISVGYQKTQKRLLLPSASEQCVAHALSTNYYDPSAVSLNVNNVYCSRRYDGKMQKRLAFYGIGQCEQHILYPHHQTEGKNITIRYLGVPVYLANVS